MLLPVAVLSLVMAIVLIPATLLTFRLDSLHAVPPDRSFAFALNLVTSQESQAVTAMNLPGTLIAVLISLPLSWPLLWRPQSVSLDLWRTLTYPFFCLPAW